MAFTRLAWYQTTPFHLGLLLITLLVFVTAVVAWLLGYRRRQPVGREAALAGLIGLLNLLFVVGSIGGIISGRIAQQEILAKPELQAGALSYLLKEAGKSIWVLTMLYVIQYNVSYGNR